MYLVYIFKALLKFNVVFYYDKRTSIYLEVLFVVISAFLN